MRKFGAALGGGFLGWLIASFILVAIFRLSEQQSDHPDSYQITVMALMTAIPSLPTTLLSTATLGLLWHDYAQKRGWRRKRHYALAGALIGAGVAALISLGWLAPAGFESGWLAWGVLGTAYATVCGALAGFYGRMWLGAQDDAPNPPTSVS